MANEITLTTRLQVVNGSNRYDSENLIKTLDQAAIGGPTPGYVTIGTTEETITFGELSTLGWLRMLNLDPTNYVQWGFATGVYGGRMRAGEPAYFRLEPGTTLYLKANTAAVKIRCDAFED